MLLNNSRTEKKLLEVLAGQPINVVILLSHKILILCLLRDEGFQRVTHFFGSTAEFSITKQAIH